MEKVQNGGLRARPSDVVGAGLSTKILYLLDALEKLIRFNLLLNRWHDLQGVERLLDGVDLKALLTDNAFDADWLKQCLLVKEA